MAKQAPDEPYMLPAQAAPAREAPTAEQKQVKLDRKKKAAVPASMVWYPFSLASCTKQRTVHPYSRIQIRPGGLITRYDGLNPLRRNVKIRNILASAGVSVAALALTAGTAFASCPPRGHNPPPPAGCHQGYGHEHEQYCQPPAPPKCFPQEWSQQCKPSCPQEEGHEGNCGPALPPVTSCEGTASVTAILGEGDGDVFDVTGGSYKLTTISPGETVEAVFTPAGGKPESVEVTDVTTGSEVTLELEINGHAIESEDGTLVITLCAITGGNDHHHM